MRGELRDIEYDEMHSTARGLFFDTLEAYVVEVYAGGRGEELGVKLFAVEDGEDFVDTVFNQPKIHGTGENQSLSISSEPAELPETDEELEAYARYVLQGEAEEGLEYTGQKDLDELEY